MLSTEISTPAEAQLSQAGNPKPVFKGAIKQALK